MSQTVQVVSIEEVTMRFGERVFQENEVNGADVGLGFFDFFGEGP